MWSERWRAEDRLGSLSVKIQKNEPRSEHDVAIWVHSIDGVFALNL